MVVAVLLQLLVCLHHHLNLHLHLMVLVGNLVESWRWLRLSGPIGAVVAWPLVHRAVLVVVVHIVALVNAVGLLYLENILVSILNATYVTSSPPWALFRSYEPMQGNLPLKSVFYSM